MDTQHEMATLIPRIFLGLIFLFQGYDKIISIGISKVVETFEHPLIVKHFPRWLLWVASTYTSLVEFIGGFFLILGIFKYYTLYLLGIDMVMVALAFSFISPMWDMNHVFFRLSLIVLLLILPNEWDRFSLDHLIFKL